MPTDDPKARLYAANIVGYLFGYAQLTNTRALALLGDPDASAYELLFSFSSPEEKNQFLALVRSNQGMGNEYIANEFMSPTTEEIRNARPLATVLPQGVFTRAMLAAAAIRIWPRWWPRAKEVISAANAAQRFLDKRLKDARDNFQEAVETSRTQFDEALTRAIREGELELVRVRARWECMYWSTIRAVARRNGVFYGSTGDHDFPGNIDPILDKVTFAWADFFGNKLSGLLERSTARMETIAEEHRLELLGVLQKISTDEASRQSLNKIGETTASVLKEILSQSQESMKEKIDRVRRNLHDTIPGHIRANMASAFETAAAERGRGMKARMLDTIGKHAKDTAKVMFADARKAVIDGVGGLVDYWGEKSARWVRR